MAFHRFSALMLILALLTKIDGSRLTQETWETTFETSTKSSSDEGTKWAVLVAGSKGYENYRHQADICHAYQILRRGGLKDENIIVFMYDDIAYNKDNPRKGIIINHPKGSDVYKGVPKDYTGENVTSSNIFAAILGNKTAINGGSGKVVESGPNDHIFIYYSDHGGDGILGMPDEADGIYAHEFISTLKKKHEMGSYKKMVIYVEACESGSIFNGLLPKDWRIYVTTASNSIESSYATYCPGSDESFPTEYNTCLGDLYSVAWMEDCDKHNTPSKETLEQQYEVVKNRTLKGQDLGSHVMQYGDRKFVKDLISTYMGSSFSYGYEYKQVPVEQHEADIIYLKQKVLKAPEGSLKRKLAQRDLDNELSNRKRIDRNFEEIGISLFGKDKGHEIITTVRSEEQTLVDDWNCFKTLAITYQAHCGTLSTYGKKYMRAFANMCNAGVQQAHLAQVALQICGK